MPGRTKPRRSSRSPDSRSAGTTSPASRRPKAELREIVEFLRDPSASRSSARACPEGHPAARAARHRQDAAGQGRRHRVRANVLRAVGRPRSSRCSPASARLASGAVRDRAARNAARRSSSSTSSTPSAPRAARHLQPRGGPDAQPAAGRDRRLRRLAELVVIAADQPPRQSRPGAAAPRPLRSPGLRAAARHRRPRGDPRGALRAASRSARTSTSTLVARHDQGSDRRGPREHLQRGRDLRRPRAPRLSSPSRDFDDALERVVAGLQSPSRDQRAREAVIAYHEAGHALCRTSSVQQVHKVSIIPRGRRSATPGACPTRSGFW